MPDLEQRGLGTVSYMDLAEFVDGGLTFADRKRYFGVNSPADLPESLATWQNFTA